MKRLFIATLCMGLAGISAADVEAASLQQAKVTRLMNDVKISHSQASSRDALIGDVVQGKTAVKTGRKSRAELKFSDETLARLGANTIFSFERGTRDLELKNGVILLQVPKGAGGAKIKTAAVTAAITGTTILFEYVPGDDGSPGYIKVIVLEGTLRLSLNGKLGESVLIEAGQMLILSPEANSLPLPVNVDIKRLVQTSGLISGKFERLHNDPLIQDEIQRQAAAKKNGTLTDTNLSIFGRGTTVFVLTDEMIRSLIDRSSVIGGAFGGEGGGSKPSGSGGSGGDGAGGGGSSSPPFVLQLNKFGRPTLIEGLSVIDELTTIITDPLIIREGVVREGTMYRDEAQDGVFSQWLYGTTSSFDEVVDIDAVGQGGTVAAFRFEDLHIYGTPVFDTTDGPTALAFISEGSLNAIDPFGEGGEFGSEFSGGSFITSSFGGTFDLAGLRLLLLTTTDGAINVGPDFSFLGTDQTLRLYARGEQGYVDFYGTAMIANGRVEFQGESEVIVGGFIQARDFLATAGELFNLASWATISAETVSIESVGNNPEGGIEIEGTITAAAQTLFGDGPIQVRGGILDGQDIRISGQEILVDNGQLTSTNNPSTSPNPGISIRAQGSGAIRIQNSSQLLALANIAGTRRSIHLSTQGGDITVSGSTVKSEISESVDGSSSEAKIEILSNGGAINISAGSLIEAVDGSVLIDTVSPVVTGLITISGSTIAGRDIKVRAAGPNGELLIGNSTLSASNLLELYADGANGKVIFTGDTTLNFHTGKVGAHTVQINNGVVVTANGNLPIEVFATDRNYSGHGGNGSTTGVWSGSGAPFVGQEIGR